MRLAMALALVPPLETVSFTGACEIVGAIGLTPRFRPLADAMLAI
jgi:hypothetical protein